MAESGQIGAFGPVVFETSSKYIRNFERLMEERTARYAEHPVLNLDSKLQFVGIGLTTVSLTMKFHAALSDPKAEREALNGVLTEHQAHPVVIGGVNFGEFVLERIGAGWEHVSNKGELIYLACEIELREYH